MIEVDARGLGCPIPVVKTKQAIEKNPGEQIIVLVDAAVAKENVSRLAACKKYNVQCEAAATEEFRLLLSPM
ncbi:MAG TPA: sulfurtransferase TusA family protein [Smithellaceae bacterium]|nr:sulfurtransferase TusA family protein [Smithellaceae bacterium]